nr:(E3-independent) E2 ubiquitin-conjugating enzyme-like isoform X2 [Danio rerio]|eukprot:XP_009299518.1 (E3-independent) E2 ubiquitin-conjugating enzyme-like isoform X2 [Danio rerio]
MSEEDGAKLYDIYPHISDVGLFFDDAYGFYPGQVLIGPAKVFANVQWLYGVKPVLSKKSKFRVVVEEVQVVELKVTWITKSYSPKGSDSVFPPPSTITQENLSRCNQLSTWQCIILDIYYCLLWMKKLRNKRVTNYLHNLWPKLAEIGGQ